MSIDRKSTEIDLTSPLAVGEVYCYGPRISPDIKNSSCLFRRNPLRETPIQTNLGMPLEGLLGRHTLQYGCLSLEERTSFLSDAAAFYGVNPICEELDGQAYLVSGLGATMLAFPAVAYSAQAGSSLTFLARGERRDFENLLAGAELNYPQVFERLAEVGTKVCLAESEKGANGSPVFTFEVVPAMQFRKVGLM